MAYSYKQNKTKQNKMIILLLQELGADSSSTSICDKGTATDMSSFSDRERQLQLNVPAPRRASLRRILKEGGKEGRRGKGRIGFSKREIEKLRNLIKFPNLDYNINRDLIRTK